MEISKPKWFVILKDNGNFLITISSKEVSQPIKKFYKVKMDSSVQTKCKKLDTDSSVKAHPSNKVTKYSP